MNISSCSKAQPSARALSFVLKCVECAVVLFGVLELSACKNTPSGPIIGNDTSSHNIIWKVDTLGTYGSSLLDIYAVSPTSAYAVGRIWDASGTVPTLVMHWDGIGWRDLRDDSLRGWVSGGVPSGVHAISDSALYIAGTRFKTRDPLPMAAFWDGKNWLNLSPPGSLPLSDIWAISKGEVYVVGAQGLIMRYDGIIWHTVTSPTQLDFHAIYRSSSGILYAVACDDFNSLKGSVVVQIGKDAATIEYSRSLGRLLGLGGTSTGDLYVVGEGVFWRGPAAEWTELTTPPPRVALRTAHAKSMNDLLIVGAFGKTIHWSGRTWQSYDQLFDASSTTWFYQACSVSDRYFIVGGTGTLALLAAGIVQ